MKFVFIIGLGIITCLFFHSCFILFQIVFLNDKSFGASFQSFWCIDFAICSFLGIIYINEIQSNPSLINEEWCFSLFLPVFLLIPTIFALGYYCIISLLQMIDTFTMNEINEENGAWMNIIFSIIKFTGLLIAFFWYLYLIQVAFIQYKIARKRAKQLLLEEQIEPPPPHQCHSQSSMDI